MKFDWTDERINRLRLLWADGWSASQIARDLGTSRNSCIGKVHRLKLPGRIAAGRRGLSGKRPAGPVRKPTAARKHPWRQIAATPPELTSDLASEPVEAVMEIPVKGITIFELTSETCRWPLWGPEKREGLYCGMKPIPGHAWCGSHCCMVYQPVESRSRRTA